MIYVLDHWVHYVWHTIITSNLAKQYGNISFHFHDMFNHLFFKCLEFEGNRGPKIWGASTVLWWA